MAWIEQLLSHGAVAEIAPAKGKNVARGFVRGIIATALGSLVGFSTSAAFAAPPAPNELPAGGQVAQGQAYINTSGSTMSVSQSSGKAVINWQTFNIGQNARVNFNQPDSSSITMNRVLSADPSSIYGRLTSNGQIFLLNPSGILFGLTARVNVGALVASTLSLNDTDFMNGIYGFYNSGNAGSVINQGNITAKEGGYIAMLAPQVLNQGIIFARMGTVAIAAGDRVTIDFNGDGLINFTVDKGTVNALIDNRNLVQADGGQVIMSAKAAGNLASAVVNNEGIIQAQTIEDNKGVIKLLGDMQSGTVQVSGTLDASAPNGGDGGVIETSAAKVHTADTARITTFAPHGNTGTWLIDPDGYTIGIDISGATLSSQLTGTNITIASISGSGFDGNINVNDTVSWSANKLTLTATNDINIHTAMAASGSASLDLEPASHKVNVGFNTDGTFKGRVDFTGTGVLTINGNIYTVINSLPSGGIPGNGYYALGSNLDASATSGWNAGAGFAPVGNFGIIFDGLGHTINSLYINRSSADDVGLFSYITGATIRNVGLTGVNITGGNHVGGLVGSNNGGTIINSYVTGSVNGSTYVGGLVGYNNTGTVSNSYSTGNVTGSRNDGNYGYYGGVGGLVGFNDFGTISNSYSIDTVIEHGSNEAGGLVGYNLSGSISNSYATGSVSGDSPLGGLAGLNVSGTISNSYATGRVSGSRYVGGLAGYNTNGTISNSFATGRVSGSSYVGGLAGYNDNNITASFWNTTSNPGLADNGLGAGLTSAQMQTLSTFVSAGWDIDNTGGTSKVWRIYDGYTYPLLRSFLTQAPITVATNVTRTYDGTAFSSNSGVDYIYYGGTAVGALNPGVYTLAVYSDQQGYDLTGIRTGTLNIIPVPTPTQDAAATPISVPLSATLDAGLLYNITQRSQTNNNQAFTPQEGSDTQYSSGVTGSTGNMGRISLLGGLITITPDLASTSMQDSGDSGEVVSSEGGNTSR